MARMAVMTFVVLAGGSGQSALRSQSTSPDVASTMIAARAVTLGSAALATDVVAAARTPSTPITLPNITTSDPALRGTAIILHAPLAGLNQSALLRCPESQWRQDTCRRRARLPQFRRYGRRVRPGARPRSRVGAPPS